MATMVSIRRTLDLTEITLHHDLGRAKQYSVNKMRLIDLAAHFIAIRSVQIIPKNTIEHVETMVKTHPTEACDRDEPRGSATHSVAKRQQEHPRCCGRFATSFARSWFLQILAFSTSPPTTIRLLFSSLGRLTRPGECRECRGITPWWFHECTNSLRVVNWRTMDRCYLSVFCLLILKWFPKLSIFFRSHVTGERRKGARRMVRCPMTETRVW